MNHVERQHRRYAHEAAITLLTPGQAISGRTRDVSQGGLCANLSESIAVGGDVEVDIQLVFEGDRQSEALRVAARVVWCTPVDDGYQVGVRFLPLAGEAAEYLAMFLRYLEDDDPAPGASDEPQETTIDDRFG